MKSDGIPSDLKWVFNSGTRVDKADLVESNESTPYEGNFGTIRITGAATGGNGSWTVNAKTVTFAEGKLTFGLPLTGDMDALIASTGATPKDWGTSITSPPDAKSYGCDFYLYESEAPTEGDEPIGKISLVKTEGTTKHEIKYMYFDQECGIVDRIANSMDELTISIVANGHIGWHDVYIRTESGVVEKITTDPNLFPTGLKWVVEPVEEQPVTD
jgi:hypothetical protein